MAETNKINAYANIKQQTSADLRLPPRQIVSDSSESTSTAGQTVINLSFVVDMANKKSFELFIDGRLLREGAGNDYTFTNIQADNTSSQVTLFDALIFGLNIIARKLGVDKEIVNPDNLKAELNRRKVYPNYILNGTFEYEEVIGWGLYNDSSSIPVDGVGGTVNSNVTFATDTTNPLRGAKSALLSKDAANRQGHGVSYDFSIDLADAGKVLSIKMDVSGSPNYQAGYVKAYIYDKTNNSLISCSPLEVSSSGQYIAMFASTTSLNYRLILHIASSDASAWSLKIDDVQVGQPDLIFGYPGSDWKNDLAFIPSPSAFGTVTGNSFWYRRTGDSMEVRGHFFSGTPTGSVGYLQLPNGYKLDTTKFSSDVNNEVVGTYALTRSSGITGIYPSNFAGLLFYDGSTDNQLFYGYDVLSNALVKAVGTNLAVSGGSELVNFTVPIANWDSNIQLSSSKVEYAYNSNTSDASDFTTFGYGPVGQAIGSYTTAERTKRVRFPNPVQQTDHIFLEVNENGNWIRLADHALNPVKQGSVRYGIRVVPVASSSTDYDVIFGDGGAEAGSSYASAGSAWSGYTSLKWRLVKSSNALGVETDILRPSEIFATGGNGYGSSNTYCRRLVTFNVTGSDIDYVDSPILGTYFTVKSKGVYAITVVDGGGSSGYLGASRNSSNGATQIYNLSDNERAVIGYYIAPQLGSASGTINCNVGDVIRMQDGTGAYNNTAGYQTSIRITKVSN